MSLVQDAVKSILTPSKIYILVYEYSDCEGGDTKILGVFPDWDSAHKQLMKVWEKYKDKKKLMAILPTGGTLYDENHWEYFINQWELGCETLNIHLKNVITELSDEEIISAIMNTI